MRTKIHDRNALAAKLKELRAANPALRVVFTNGCFDLLHVGHVRYLGEARGLGDVLIVAVNDDASVQRLKGSERPILKEAERERVLAGLGCVDYVTRFHEDTPAAIIEELRPDVLVKGGDYRTHEIVGNDRVGEWGGETHSLALIEGRSSSDLIRRVLELRGAKA